ncbi:hypothetical protein F5878DRAFT_276672 [Lentinula raphanica]|uniref:Uncharacterized protein n=1 Tax=Lentinula raphanica TaxID=153919 RepID=A0AA38ULW6_9AGAR|nr:hypothetical protein F5878DRAFT_276672 [Lentinula raphanica]
MVLGCLEDLHSGSPYRSRRATACILTCLSTAMTSTSPPFLNPRCSSSFTSASPTLIIHSSFFSPLLNPFIFRGVSISHPRFGYSVRNVEVDVRASDVGGKRFQRPLLLNAPLSHVLSSVLWLNLFRRLCVSLIMLFAQQEICETRIHSPTLSSLPPSLWKVSLASVVIRSILELTPTSLQISTTLRVLTLNSQLHRR